MLRTLHNKVYDKLEEAKDFDFYDELIKRAKQEDIIPFMENNFKNEIGNKLCPIGAFRNIVDRSLGYNRRDFPPFIVNNIAQEFQDKDPRLVSWIEFIDKCKIELDISFDLDEVLGCLYQWMKYNNMYSLHEVFKSLEIDRTNFKDTCKKAGSNASVDKIHRIFDKYSKLDSEDNVLDYDKFEKYFDDKKPSLIAKFK
jgi:hypothetical protein